LTLVQATRGYDAARGEFRPRLWAMCRYRVLQLRRYVAAKQRSALTVSEWDVWGESGFDGYAVSSDSGTDWLDEARALDAEVTSRVFEQGRPIRPMAWRYQRLLRRMRNRV